MTNKEFREMCWKDWKLLTGCPSTEDPDADYDTYLSGQLYDRENFRSYIPPEVGRTYSTGPC